MFYEAFPNNTRSIPEQNTCYKCRKTLYTQYKDGIETVLKRYKTMGYERIFKKTESKA